MTNDDRYAAFLLALDRSEVTVSDWEAGFIEINLDRFGFSPKQRAMIEKMMDKYAERIGFTDRP